MSLCQSTPATQAKWQTCFYCVYHETVSKTNSGGLAHSKLKPKIMEHFANIVDPKRVFCIRTRNIEASSQDIALQMHSTLHLSGDQDQIAGIPNDQLATTYWVLWWGGLVILLESLTARPIIPYIQLQKGLDEQLIIHVTGCRSTTAVRCYKPISEDQKQHLSFYLEVEQRIRNLKNNKLSKTQVQMSSCCLQLTLPLDIHSSTSLVALLV